MSITALASVIIGKCASYLNETDYANLSVTNKSMNGGCKNLPPIQHVTIYFKDLDSPKFKSLYAQLLYARLQSVTLWNFCSHQTGSISALRINKLLRMNCFNFKYVKKLQFINYKSQFVPESKRNLFPIQYAEALCNLFLAFINLNYLEFHDTFLNTEFNLLLHENPNLKKIFENITYLHVYESSDIVFNYSSVPNLKAVHFNPDICHSNVQFYHLHEAYLQFGEIEECVAILKAPNLRKVFGEINSLSDECWKLFSILGSLKDMIFIIINCETIEFEESNFDNIVFQTAKQEMVIRFISSDTKIVTIGLLPALLRNLRKYVGDFVLIFEICSEAVSMDDVQCLSQYLDPLKDVLCLTIDLKVSEIKITITNKNCAIDGERQKQIETFSILPW